MSVLTDLIYGGSHAVAGLTEGAVKDAIAKHGADAKVAFPDTAYFLPTIYAATGVKVKTLGDLTACVEVQKSLISDKEDLGEALNAGLATAVGAEIIEALKYVESSEPYANDSGIGFVPENRKLEGLFLSNTIKYNITLPILEKFMGFIGVNNKREMSIVDRFVHELSIKMTGVDQQTVLLSGGNQQKVVLGKWVAATPRVFILDTPTVGVDIGSKSEIYEHIQKLADEGVAIIMISDEVEEIVANCNRVAVMFDGEIIQEFGEDVMREDGAGKKISTVISSLTAKNSGEEKAV